MARGVFAYLALATAACTSATPAPAPAPASVPVEPPRAPATPEPEPSAAPLPEIREPGAVACRITADSWSLSKLRTRRSGPVFAEVRAAPAAVVLPVTERAEAATAVLDDGQVVVRALVDVEDLELYPLPQTTSRGPVALLGIVVPQAQGAMGWVSGASGARVGVSIDASSIVVSPSPVVDTVACDQLTLVPEEFDVRALFTKKKNLPTRWLARDGVPIQRNLKAEPAAELGGQVEVEVLEVRGALTLILYETPTFLVLGWVPSKDLTTTAGAGVGYGTGRGSYARPFSSFRGDRCDGDLPLIVELGTERTIVGMIRAKSSFRIMEQADTPRRRSDFVAVELPVQPWLRPVPPARFVVSAGELARCKP